MEIKSSKFLLNTFLNFLKPILSCFSSRLPLTVGLIVWFIVTSLYLLHTPGGTRTHDFDGHFQYSEILLKEDRLPFPHEGWGTYGPPAYYLINSFIAQESLKSPDKHFHVDCVKALSVVYGALAVFIIYWFIKQVTSNVFFQILSILFVITTPKFVFILSSYNNDSLVTLLNVAILALSYKLYKNWSRKGAVLLYFISTLGLYTKLTAMIPIFIVITLCLKELVQKKSIEKVKKRIIIVLLISLVSLLPWAIFHNYQHAGKLFPNNDDGLSRDLIVTKNKSFFNIISPTAIFQADKHKWDDPFSHPWNDLQTKRYDYFTFNFITSVIGEYTFTSPSQRIIWLLLLFHLILKILALTKILISPFSRLAGAVILIAHLLQIIDLYSLPVSCGMDYRYLAVLYAPWGAVFANMLSNTKNKFNNTICFLFFISIALNIYVLLTMRGG